MDQDAKSRFMAAYARLPINIRNEIVIVADEEPITWHVAYLEIRKETKLGEKVLNKLIVLGIV